MTDTRSPFSKYMQECVIAREAQNFDRSLERASLAESEAMSDAELAQSRQAKMIALRLLGRLDEARGEAGAADAASERANNPQLQGDICADHGEIWHDMALAATDPKKRDSYFDMAIQLFDSSIELLSSVGDGAGVQRTYGFWGMMLFDQGLKDEGIGMMVGAFQRLRDHYDNRVYLVNLMIRLMRASFWWRWYLLTFALELTKKGSESAGSRTKVLAALAGNKAFLRLKRWQQSR